MKEIVPYFGLNPLDRKDYLRDNKIEIFKFLDSNNSFFLLFDGNNILVDENKKQYFFKKEILDGFDINKEKIVFLGTFEDKIYFAFSIKGEKALSKIPLREFLILDYIDIQTLGIVAQASCVLNWHDSHPFCSCCGKKTIISRVGWRRDCPNCKKEHFPRVDPVVIMLVTLDDYALIGRGVNFPEGRYSCLAGYVESGERLEDAALRELFEEAGVRGKEVEYAFSQPWPFPSTLMVGMHIKATTKELTIDKNEIADAKWVHKNDIKAVLEGNDGYDFTLPLKFTIARNLLEYWIKD